MTDTRQAQELELPHRLTLDARSRLSMTGVTEVESFDEGTVVLVTARPGADRRGRRAVLPASAGRAAGAGALCRRRPAAAVLFSGDRARRVGVLPDARPPAPACVFVGFFGNRAHFSPDFGSGKNFFEKMPYFFQKVLCKCEKMVYNIQYSAMRAGRIRPGKECREK